MEWLGKPVINQWLFYTGIISGYIVWSGFIYSFGADFLTLARSKGYELKEFWKLISS